MKRYLVLNKPRNEGAMFDDEDDAKRAAGRKKMGSYYSSLAEHFYESYSKGSGKLKIIEIDIPEA